ncbi:BZ3501_MvSof-1269-A2-R1_Chr6-2g08641 [Microbotryum saponariae]|nr:BZ3501_MvSof-1269-A2-R1_Chr6-2g08641 [Microbotryum saponariae]
MGLARLLVLASVMLVATVIASSLPQWIRFSPRRLHQLSVYSTGLLIGAALTIVIPEGVAAVYANSSSLHHHAAEHEAAHGSPYRHDAHSNPTNIGLALLAGFLLMYLIDTYTHSHPPASSVGRLDRSNSRHPHRYLTRQSSSISELEPLNANSSHHHQHHYRNGDDEYDWAENGNLGTANADRKSLAPTSSSSINGGTSANPSRSSSPTHHHPPSPPNEPIPSSSPSSPSSSASAISTVIGLVVHSLADGVSLGASSLPSGEQAVTQVASSTSLELIIFLAIMVHKAPAAFALSSLLSSNRSVSPSFLRKSLLAFSLAAPLGALTTYGLLTLVGVELEGVQGGIGGESSEDGEENGKGGGPVWVVAGMLTPWVLGRLVGHGH